MDRRPIVEGLFKDSVPPRLLGSQCAICGEAFFPKQRRCLNCLHHPLDEVELGPHGRLYSYTIVRQRPDRYDGPMPYVVGQIRIGDDVQIQSVISNVDPDQPQLSIDQHMALVIEPIGETETVSYFFRPSK